MAGTGNVNVEPKARDRDAIGSSAALTGRQDLPPERATKPNVPASGKCLDGRSEGGNVLDRSPSRPADAGAMLDAKQVDKAAIHGGGKDRHKEANRSLGIGLILRKGHLHSEPPEPGVGSEVPAAAELPELAEPEPDLGRDRAELERVPEGPEPVGEGREPEPELEPDREPEGRSEGTERELGELEPGRARDRIRSERKPEVEALGHDPVRPLAIEGPEPVELEDREPEASEPVR